MGHKRHKLSCSDVSPKIVSNWIPYSMCVKYLILGFNWRTLNKYYTPKMKTFTVLNTKG